MRAGAAVCITPPAEEEPVAEAAASLAIRPGSIVSGFWPIRSEVDVRPLMFALREQGARLCLPAILDKTTIVFRELVPGAPLVDMGFGTRGPGVEAEILDPSLMLVPLAISVRFLRMRVTDRLW